MNDILELRMLHACIQKMFSDCKNDLHIFKITMIVMMARTTHSNWSINYWIPEYYPTWGFYIQQSLFLDVSESERSSRVRESMRYRERTRERERIRINDRMISTAESENQNTKRLSINQSASLAIKYHKRCFNWTNIRWMCKRICCNFSLSSFLYHF